MNRSYSKLFSVLLCIVMLLALLPASAFAQEESFSLVFEGGSASIKGGGAFSGSAKAGEVLEVKLTPQSGRTFKYWKSPSGLQISEPDFSMLVGADVILYAVFEDSASLEWSEWTLVKEGNCVEGNLMKRTNSKGDAEYKYFYLYSDHDLGECVKVDDEHHKQVCSRCGYEYVSEHWWLSEETVREATHEQTGLTRQTCGSCGAVIETEIPKTTEHVWGPWEVVTPSKNGDYGVRRRSCVYCDSHEDYWYLDVDFKPVLQNHYIEYMDSYGGKITNNERYYHYVNTDGKDVYVMALQYVYSYSSGNDGGTSWIWTYVDDGDDSTWEPVYLSRSTGETMPYYVQAEYGYVNNFAGYLDAIDNPDFVASGLGNCGYFSNTMGARSSALLSWTRVYWANKFNDMLVPVSVADPSSKMITTTGEFGKWEKTGSSEENSYAYSSFTVDTGEKDGENHAILEEYGGFKNWTSYRKWVSGDEDSKQYDFITIDNDSGMAISYTTYTTAYRTEQYFGKYLDIVTDAEREAMPEYKRKAFVPVSGIETRIKEFCSSNGRNSFPAFTLDIPEDPSAVRLHVMGTIGDSIVQIDANGQYTNASYNNAHVYYVPQNSSYPNEKKVTLSWNNAKAGTQVFDRFEIFDQSTREWKVLTTEKSITLNTYDAPFKEATFIRYISHTSEVKHHVTVNNGYFITGGDYETKYTDADVTEGTKIELRYNAIDGKIGTYFEDEEGNTFGARTETITKDKTYTAHYDDQKFSAEVQAYEYGKVWVVGHEEEKGSYASTEGVKGAEVRFSTEGDTEEGYTEFLGWYNVIWGKGKNPIFELISKDLVLTYTIDGYMPGPITAVWSDGTVDLEPEPEILHIKVTGGGFAVYSGGDGGELVPDPGAGASGFNAYTAFDASEYASIMLVDDPTDSIRIGSWKAEFTTADGPQEETIPVDFEYGDAGYFVQYFDYYAAPDIVFTGIEVEPCADDQHVWGEGTVTKEPTHTEEGEMTYVCTVCGTEKTEAIDKTTEHSFGEWKDDANGTTHSRACECGEKETADHTWNEGEVTTAASHVAEGVKTFTCTVCGAIRTEPVAKNEEHAFGEWTPDGNGTTHSRSCECGEKETEAHTMGEWQHSPNVPGSHFKVCSVCGYMLTEPHSYGEGEKTKEPTHTEPGEMVYTCSVCGEVKTEQLATVGDHSFGPWEPDATNGIYHHRTCACGISESAEHSFGEAVVTKEASYDAEGEQVYTCSVCGYQKSESIEKLAWPGAEISTAVDASGDAVKVDYTDDVPANIRITTNIAANVNNEAAASDTVTVELVDGVAGLNQVRAADLRILFQKDVTVPEGTTFPVSLTFDGLAASEDEEVFVYHYNGIEWELIAVGKGSSVTASFSSLSPVAIVAKKAAPTTPQTGDDMVFIWCAALAVAAGIAATTFFARKRRED